MVFFLSELGYVFLRLEFSYATLVILLYEFMLVYIFKAYLNTKVLIFQESPRSMITQES